jgi:amino acid permease
MFFLSRKTQRAMGRRKTLAEAQAGDSSGGGQQQQLRRTLTAVDLVLYGVGSSVGAGIFVLVGLYVNKTFIRMSLSLVLYSHTVALHFYYNTQL